MKGRNFYHFQKKSDLINRGSVLALRHGAVRVGEMALTSLTFVDFLIEARLSQPDRRITQNSIQEITSPDAKLTIVKKKFAKQDSSRGQNLGWSAPRIKEVILTSAGLTHIWVNVILTL